MNKLIIIGNLTSDPSLRTVNTASGATSVCSFAVAVNRREKKEADFFRVAAWGKRGEICNQYLSKGKKVEVSGPVSVRTYQANDGSTRASMEIVADEVEFLSPANESASEVPPAAPTAQAQFVPVSDDDLPF